jgi:Protein of unknown function (DUF4012)
VQPKEWVRARWRWCLAVLLVVLLLPGAALGYRAAQGLQRSVVAHFSAAQSHLERARTLVAQASGAQAQTTLTRARKEFESAQIEFRAGAAAVTGSPARVVPTGLPFAGGRIAAVEHLGAMGLALCDAGLRSIDVDAQFLKPAAAGQPTGTARLLGILVSLQGEMPPLRRDLELASREAAAIDPSVVPASEQPALQRARSEIAKGIAGVTELDRLVPAIDDILGVDGRRTYVVEQVNPFELRAGGGYIGTYSLLAADRGSLTVLRSGDTHDLPDFSTVSGQDGYVAPPAAMVGLLQQKSWSFGDTNFYPDFAENARAAMSFAQRDFGTGVDGVISIDLYAVAALIGVTGPISVPGSGTTLTKDNAIPTIMAADLSNDPSHKQVISSVAGPLMQRLVSLDSSQWLGVVQVLNQLATGRHLQLFFASGQAETEMQRLGLAGDLAVSNHGDFLYPGEANFAGNKANFFLTRQYQLSLSRSGDTLHHVLTENLTLDLSHAPPGYVVPYDFFARVLLPASATGVQVTGLTRADQPSLTPPAGVTLLEGSASLQPYTADHTARMQVTYAWDTAWYLEASGTHTIYWQKQPGMGQDQLTVTWTNGGATATAKSDLGSDRLVRVGPGAKVTIAQGNAAQVSLPRL